VILEALLAGCPVLLSDQTPWRDLSVKCAGFDLPLNEAEKFHRAIEEFAAMDHREFAKWSAGARNYGITYCTGSDLVQATRNMFEGAIGA
jgi:glycosyltransferase involved in cell wall biosynthesis